MNVLVIAPHADDEILGCGGVIARHIALGDHVEVVVMCRAQPDVAPPELVAHIKEEAYQAHAVLGIHQSHFWEFPAARLDTISRRELVEALSKLISQLQPELVYLPHHGDLHADHQAVYLAGLVAARPINHCPVRRLLSYETLSETEWASPTAENAFVPTVFVDISDYLPVKLKAMACYATQLKDPPYPRSLLSIEALAHYRGGTCGLLAAEAFMLVREIVD